MSNELIEVFDIEVLPANADVTQLRKIAKEKATFVVEKVHNLTKNLREAEDLSFWAEHTDDDGWFSRTFGDGKTAAEKRSKLNTEVNTLQNKAIAELANLVQASIQFAATSAVLNQAMLEEFAKVCNEGFIDVYDKVQEIREEEREYLKQIENGLKNNQKIHQQRESTAKNQASILQNAESISANKDLISQNADFIAQNKQAIKNIKILAWIAIALSAVSLSIGIFSLLK